MELSPLGFLTIALAVCNKTQLFLTSWVKYKLVLTVCSWLLPLAFPVGDGWPGYSWALHNAKWCFPPQRWHRAWQSRLKWPLLRQPKHFPFRRRIFFLVSGSVTTAHLVVGCGPLQKVHHVSLFSGGLSLLESRVDDVGGLLFWPGRNPNPNPCFSFDLSCSFTGPKAHLLRIHNSSVNDFMIVSRSHSSDASRLRIRRNSCGIFPIITGVKNVPYVSVGTPIPWRLLTAASVLSKSCRNCFRSFPSFTFGSYINNSICFEMMTSLLPKRLVNNSTAWL